MPISYERDDAQHRILAVGEGIFRADDVLEMFARMRAEGVWSYSTLQDLRRMSGRPSVSDLRVILEAGRQHGTDGRARGPIAVVVTDPMLYGMACAYAALGPAGAFEVFQDRAEAEAWLAQTSRSAP
jgi:hypothetical protein